MVPVFIVVVYITNEKLSYIQFIKQVVFSFCHFSNSSVKINGEGQSFKHFSSRGLRIANAITFLISPTQTRWPSARTIEKLRAHEDNASVSRGRERVL